MSPQELKIVADTIAELSQRMARLEENIAEVKRLARDRKNRVVELERKFDETDQCVAEQLFGPDEGDEVRGDTLSERVESLEKVISNGEVKILIGGRAP